MTDWKVPDLGQSLSRLLVAAFADEPSWRLNHRDHRNDQDPSRYELGGYWNMPLSIRVRTGVSVHAKVDLEPKNQGDLKHNLENADKSTSDDRG